MSHDVDFISFCDALAELVALEAVSSLGLGGFDIRFNAARGRRRRIDDLADRAHHHFGFTRPLLE